MQRDGTDKRTRQSERQVEVWMLNLRFALIVLVFVAAGIEPLTGRFGVLETLYTWIFTFHIPLFVFVTGYFARRNLLGPKGCRPLLAIAVQYAVFQTLYTVADQTFFHSSAERPSFFIPYLMLWFLVAHFGWRIVLRLMLWARIKHPVLWSFALGIGVGYWSVDGSWLSLSRMLVFLPFFAAGYVIHPARLIEWYKRFPARALSIGSLALLLTVHFLWNGTPEWLYGKFTYGEMGVTGVSGGTIRIGFYLLQFVAGAAFLSLIPRKVSIWTDLGSRTLYVFLLHGVFVRSWIRLDIYSGIRDWSGVLLLIAIIVLLTILLAQPQIRSLTRWLIEPDLGRYVSRLMPSLDRGILNRHNDVYRKK